MGSVVKSEGFTPMRRQRLIIGKTLTECAVQARTSKQALSHYESKIRVPHPHKMRDVAYAYQLTIEQLVDMLR